MILWIRKWWEPPAPTDTERLNWIEEYVRVEGAMLLHDGIRYPSLERGGGLAFGKARKRDLREAIDQAMGRSKK